MARKRKAQEPLEVEEEEEEEGTSSEEDSDDSSSSSAEEEDDDESSKREKLRKLLEPFSKDQIIAFLKEEALKDPSILSRIVHKADSDPNHRKIFIYGLGYDATEEQLLQVFKPFGEIEELKLITDKVTGRAKGYAFALFKTRSAAEEALKAPQKKIGGRTASCQLAALGPAAGERRLFVSNVGPALDVDRLRAFFGKFGEIEDGPLGLDPLTNKPRGSAIFVYKSADGLKKALEEPIKYFDGWQLSCKKFVEGLNSSNVKNNNSSSSNQQQNHSDVNYGFSLDSGNFGSNLNAGGMLTAQNAGIGLIGNPMLAAVLNHSGLAATLNQSGSAAALNQLGSAAALKQSGSAAAAAALNQSGLAAAALNQSGLAAAMAGIGGNYGINSLSPSVTGSYGALAALQLLGAYQSAQMGQSSVGANAAREAVETESAAQAQSGIESSVISLPSYFSR